MRRGYADTPQGQIHYMTVGDGEPLLLLHKTGSSRQYWRLMPLLAASYQTIAPDNLGSGNSDPLPPHVRIADLARSMIDFMDFLGIEKAHIFGFHTGNKIATEMAAAWPSRVKNLILCGHTHSIMADHAALNAALMAVVGPSIRTFDPKPDGSHLVKQWAADFGAVTNLWWDTGNFAWEKLTPELFQRRKERVVDKLQIRGVEEVYRAIFDFDLGARMRQITARTLLIEVAVPQEKHLGRQGEKLVKLIAGSQLATVEHTAGGNVVEVEAEQLAKLILAFLKGDASR
jgi:pimeloyl-ACP methyl ester carboxylesterase